MSTRDVEKWIMPSSLWGLYFALPAFMLMILGLFLAFKFDSLLVFLIVILPTYLWAFVVGEIIYNRYYRSWVKEIRK